MPRVKGYPPGRPRRSSSPGATSDGPAAAGSGIPEVVCASGEAGAAPELIGPFLPDQRPAAHSEPATARAVTAAATATPSITDRRVVGTRSMNHPTIDPPIR